MSSGHVVLLAIACILGSVVLQAIRPGDTIAILLATAGTTALAGGYVAKHRESTRRKKVVEDLEQTATNLRAELFEATRTK